MHFSIPEVSEIKDINQGNFKVYHVHANGILHCKLRFKQFNSLHEQLKKQFGIYSLPYFPPKKFFALNEIEIEERRALLEKYMQIISQDERISNSCIFNDFLLNAQQTTLNAVREPMKLDILLADNSLINCQLMSTDNTNTVKETICRELKLPIKYTPYFSLFITKEKSFRSFDQQTSSSDKEFNNFINHHSKKNRSNSLTNKNQMSFSSRDSSIENSDDKFINLTSKFRGEGQANSKSTDFNYIIIRKMMDFEAPCLSLLNANQTSEVYYLKLIKFYWHVDLDDKLIENDVALNLIYLQAVNDFERQSSELNRDHYQYLESLALRQSKKEYITFARCIKNYGQIWFEQCICDFPKPNTTCLISIKNNELTLRTLFSNGSKHNGINKYNFKDFILRIARIRCWRLTTGFDLRSPLLNSNNEIKNNTRNGNWTIHSKNKSNNLKQLKSSSLDNSSSNNSSLSNSPLNTSSLSNSNFLNSSQENDFKYELSIEYLISKDDLRWIVIKSEQAVLMSTCLKSIIEELVLKKNNLPLYNEKSNEISVNLRKNSCNYYKSNDKTLNNNLGYTMEKSLSVETFLVGPNRTKYLHNQPKNHKFEKPLVQNSAYDGIDDDDL